MVCSAVPESNRRFARQNCSSLRRICIVIGAKFQSKRGAEKTNYPRIFRDFVTHRNLEQRRSTCVFCRLLARALSVCRAIEELHDPELGCRADSVLREVDGSLGSGGGMLQ